MHTARWQYCYRYRAPTLRQAYVSLSAAFLSTKIELYTLECSLVFITFFAACCSTLACHVMTCMSLEQDNDVMFLLTKAQQAVERTTHLQGALEAVGNDRLRDGAITIWLLSKRLEGNLLCPLVQLGGLDSCSAFEHGFSQRLHLLLCAVHWQQIARSPLATDVLLNRLRHLEDPRLDSRTQRVRTRTPLIVCILRA